MRERFTDLGRIDPGETLDGGGWRALESHLARGGSICERRVRTFGWRRPEPRLVPEIKRRVMRAVESDSPGTGRIRPPEPVASRAPGGFGSRLLWVCATVVGLASVFSMWHQWRLNEELATYRSGLAELRDHVGGLQVRLDREDGSGAFSNDPGVQQLLLSGTSRSPEARGKVLWSAREGRMRFYASKLPPLSEKKTYQLWMIADKPMGAGTFRVDREGQGFLEVVDLAGSSEVEKFAVSMEPAGGALQLTGDIYLTGSF